MKRFNSSRVLSVRFNQSQFVNILDLAEKNNMNASEVVREAVNQYQDNDILIKELKKLEKQIAYKTFEAFAATLNLDDVKKQVAYKKFRTSVNNGGNKL